MWEKINSGGFLAGKKTYLLVILSLLTAVGQWATGEVTLTELFGKLPELLGLASIAALRAGLSASLPRPGAVELLAEVAEQSAYPMRTITAFPPQTADDIRADIRTTLMRVWETIPNQVETEQEANDLAGRVLQRVGLP
jgi:hypothetical protein